MRDLTYLDDLEALRKSIRIEENEHFFGEKGEKCE